MFVYTFRSGFVKCITGMMIGEAAISFIWLPCVVCVNAIEGRGDLLMFYGEIQLTDLLLIPFTSALFSVFDLICREQLIYSFISVSFVEGFLSQ